MTIGKLGQAADYVAAAPLGAVRSISGVELGALIAACGTAPGERRTIAFKWKPARDVAGYLDQALAALAEAALRLWPYWWGDAQMLGRDDALGRQAVTLAVEKAARIVPGVSSAWAATAARLALSARAPRVKGFHRANEARQLGLAICPTGLALVVEVVRPAQTDALVPALEGLARQIGASVTALFADLPDPAPPFDRILYAARDFRELRDAEEVAVPDVWIAPTRGLPHPISEIEQRLAAAIALEPDLAELFEFNRTITTVRGTTPRVDLLWRAGRLVIEVDGYNSHGNRISFQDDRHRDYELILSGYTILRLTNDEVADDLERVVAKIRDVAKVCRDRIDGG